MVTAKGIMLPLFPFVTRDGQLVFLTAEEKASLAEVNPGSSEPSDSSLLGRLSSSDISSVYRLGKGTSGLVWKYFYWVRGRRGRLGTKPFLKYRSCFDVKLLFVS